ncbi:protein SDA1-like protein [Iris pallida]|uniref:Protein SDA1 n=1 Tax=Iris pallida TaxID=29817 RepID=A0AAX6ELL7_IRIPA|nr:protein SDA1-like protein [Iris pallida]
MPAADIFSPESLSASGRSSEKLSLPSLQSKMKSDPDGYLSELHLILRHFDSSLDLFRRHSSLSTSTDPSVSKELGDFAMFLAHVAPFYPDHVDEFPGKVAELLREDGRSLPSSLRCHLVQALILLINRKVVGIEETLELFMDLQTLGDRTLRKLAFSHVVQSIRRMNQKHKNEAEKPQIAKYIVFDATGRE